MVLYPDNVKRHDRVQGLISNISNYQRDIAVKYDSLLNYENTMFAALDELRKQQGLPSMEALAKKIQSELPGETQKAYIEANQGLSVFGETEDTIHMVSGILAKAASSAEKIALAIKVFKSVPVIRAIMQLAKGIKLIVTEGIEVGLEFLKTTAAALKILYNTSEIGGALGEMLNVISKVSTVMEYVSYVLNVVAFILQVFEEKAQRDKLIENIHVALPARISVSYYKDQAEHTAINISTLSMFSQLYTAGQKGDANAKVAADALSEVLLKNLADPMSSVVINAEITQWAVVDKNIGAYIKDDLPEDEIRKKAQEDIGQFQKDVDNALDKTK